MCKTSRNPKAEFCNYRKLMTEKVGVWRVFLNELIRSRTGDYFFSVQNLSNQYNIKRKMPLGEMYGYIKL